MNDFSLRFAALNANDRRLFPNSIFSNQHKIISRLGRNFARQRSKPAMRNASCAKKMRA
jgi:hypothetical protein